MSYKLSFHSKNVLPYFGANQGQMPVPFQVFWTSFSCCRSPLLSCIFKCPRLKMTWFWDPWEWSGFGSTYRSSMFKRPHSHHNSSFQLRRKRVCNRAFETVKQEWGLELLLSAKLARLFGCSVGVPVWPFRHLNASAGCSGPEQQPRKKQQRAQTPFTPWKDQHPADEACSVQAFVFLSTAQEVKEVYEESIKAKWHVIGLWSQAKWSTGA